MLLALSLLTQAAPAAAPPQPPAVAQAAAPVAKSTGLPADVRDYFTGRWTGSGAFVRSKKPLESNFSFEPEMDGQVLLVRHAEKAPQKFAYLALWSVDTVSGDLVMLLSSNVNGGARLFRSAGWEGDRLVFRPDTNLQTWFAQERITFTRESATRFRARYEMSRDGITWGGGDEQVFTKT